MPNFENLRCSSEEDGADFRFIQRVFIVHSSMVYVRLYGQKFAFRKSQKVRKRAVSHYNFLMVRDFDFLIYRRNKYRPESTQDDQSFRFDAISTYLDHFISRKIFQIDY